MAGFWSTKTVPIVKNIDLDPDTKKSSLDQDLAKYMDQDPESEFEI